ncbi:unnamed protein product [Gordionus sp. m RMFG-2023]
MSSEELLYDTIAQKLLQAKFYNTALEFQNELYERGKYLPRLNDYLSNQDYSDKWKTTTSLRRASSVQTLESIDITRYSDDSSNFVDERIAGIKIIHIILKVYIVLEFELRKANETIRLLRGNIDQQAGYTI